MEATEKQLHEIADFFVMRKGNYINYQHGVSGSSTIVYPIAIWVEQQEVDIQLLTTDSRCFRNFDKVLKKKFPCVKGAFVSKQYKEYRIYCKY
ncbi:MAG: hypothetical protein J5725_13320 [Bacteroidales bacterium]|nr:hypothetical protein [Bacteroidales bacterium]